MDAGGWTNAPEGVRTARERILDAAYALFSHRGIRAVGIDTIIAQAGVAKMTLYHHFPSKADLVLAFLDSRRRRWTCDWLSSEVDRLAVTPRQRCLAVFDVLDEWFHTDDYESCAFICTLLEVRDKADPVHQEAARQLDVIRQILQAAAEQAGARDPVAAAYQLQILMMGAIVSATRADLDAARRARELAELLLDGVCD